MTLNDHPVELHTIPCLEDNYAFVLHNIATNTATVVDVPDAAPIVEKLKDHNADLADIILTHHHWDHVDGLQELQHHFPNAKVYGAAADQHRLPPLDIALHDAQTLDIMGFSAHCIDVSGHTIGHIAIHFPSLGVAFTADSLMAMGCGRLFEGTPQQMWQSLLKLRALPPETMICSGHEYTVGNMAFAQSLGEDNPALTARANDMAALRKAGTPTVPSVLQLECETNPFLRADHPSLMRAVNMENAVPSDVFAEIRSRKDNF